MVGKHVYALSRARNLCFFHMFEKVCAAASHEFWEASISSGSVCHHTLGSNPVFFLHAFDVPNERCLLHE